MDIDYNKLVAANLRRLRNEANLTQEKLSEKSGVSSQQLSKIERGKSSPTVETLGAIAQALGVSPAAFFDKTTFEGFLYLYTSLDPKGKD